MAQQILLTSFTTWLPHQPSNSSDDLLTELCQREARPDRISLLRQLPVCFEQAPALVLDKINELQPEVVVCCGMAENRSRLSLESQAVQADQILATGLDLEHLATGLTATEISHDAGRFVCNALYYAVLHHGQQSSRPYQSMFVHVPRLTEQNRAAIATDFLTLLYRLASL